MAKFYGKIGYTATIETRPGIWEKVVTEKNYYGDLLSYNRYWQSGDKINDDISINAQISIIADSYLLNNMQCIKYAELNGVLWEVTSIDPIYPRLTLSLGGIYHE